MFFGSAWAVATLRPRHANLVTHSQLPVCFTSLRLTIRRIGSLDGDDNVVSLFIKKVQDLWNAVHHLWQTSLFVHLNSSNCSPVLCWLTHSPPVECNSLIWDVVVGTGPSKHKSLISLCLASLFPILSITFSCEKTSAGSSLEPSWINMALIATLLIPRPVYLVRLRDHETQRAMMVSKCADLNSPMIFFSLMTTYINSMCLSNETTTKTYITVE